MTSTSRSFLDSADEVIFASDPTKWHTRYLVHGEEDQDGEAGGEQDGATATGVGLAGVSGDPGLEVDVGSGRTWGSPDW